VLGWTPEEHTIQDLYQRLVRELRGLSCRTLGKEPAALLTLIDEADYLVHGTSHPLLNITRDVGDESGHGIIYLSTTNHVFDRRLATPTAFTAQVSSRIIDRVNFDRPSLAQAALFAKQVEEVTFEPDLVRWCWTASRRALEGGSLARLQAIYQAIEADAKAAGVTGTLGFSRCAELGLGGVSRVAEGKEEETAADSPSEIGMPRMRGHSG
jgi:hypothetical protein